jgi:SAM-dependent methyltransferase
VPSGPDAIPMYAGTDVRSRVASRAGARARRRRHRRFFPLTGAGAHHRIVDIGCGTAGLRALEPALDITGVDIAPGRQYPGPFVRADASCPLPFADHEFDLAYSNSLIEHLPRERRELFAHEVARVARGYLVQTPAYSFPIEPHALLPIVHWLPERARPRLWSLGVGGSVSDTLLRRSELQALFDAPVLAERIGPITKGWIALRPIPSS